MSYPMAQVHRRMMMADDATMREVIKMANATIESEKDKKRKKGRSFWKRLSTPQKIVVGSVAALALLATGGTVAAVAGRKKKSDDYMLSEWEVNNLSYREIEALKQKRSSDEFTNEEWEYMNDVSPEHAEEWLDRDEDLRDMSLEDFDDLQDFADHADLDFDDVVEWKW